MRRAALAAVLLLSCGCASLKPGPTKHGVAFAVGTRDKAEASRRALDSALPYFLDAAARREKAAALDAAVFAKPAAFLGRKRFPKKGDPVVEVRLDALSAGLQKAGLVRPPGYAAGPELVLIAFGDRKTGPGAADRLAADYFETALFGRGIQAKDADDRLIKLAHPLKAKTEEGAAAEALAGGWSWLAAGRVEMAARRDPESAAWRAKAALEISLYGGAGASEPARFAGDGEAVDVSSLSAVSRAIESAAQTAAARVEAEMAKKRAGRETVALFLSGAKDPVYLRRVLRDLRAVPGVEGAALVEWRALDDMALLHAYAVGLGADMLAARLLRQDSSLRVGSIETEDRRILLEGPEIPISEDRGN